MELATVLNFVAALPPSSVIAAMHTTRDQRHEEGVLHQGGATLFVEAGPQPGGEEFE